MSDVVRPAPSRLELDLMNKRAERAVLAALQELDGAADEPLLAMMTATLVVVHALQAVAALESELKAVRMLAGFQADTATKVLVALTAARELLGRPAGQA